eukprot:CAMPEP_0174386482 /NCGR_PEP_ID=MMETSP0811_2-20130205/127307_1 /TAXON_ID=73025 ORGANISM="Eutreptiella gymnastica-like, Strain CCMP1594" /NCGR_SAMPLE_ID=MMETSP0811_2 /ASSEMBLY_ACC=CAM_ASM_000667 /LENGTH=206 /DNA_ID=CAMNT_0015541177 /DNA_START=1 /DNA_END=621 /DNA_ORIENTATION=-
MVHKEHYAFVLVPLSVIFTLILVPLALISWVLCAWSLFLAWQNKTMIEWTSFNNPRRTAPVRMADSDNDADNESDGPVRAAFNDGLSGVSKGYEEQLPESLTDGSFGDGTAVYSRVSPEAKTSRRRAVSPLQQTVPVALSNQKTRRRPLMRLLHFGLSICRSDSRYDLGPVANLKSVMGERVWLWLLPVAPSFSAPDAHSLKDEVL